MAYQTYLATVKLTVSATDYTFKVWNLRVAAESYVGTDNIAQQAPDGSWRQKISGWHIRATFQAMNAIYGTDHHVAQTAIEALYDAGSGTLDLDPDDDPGVKTLTVVPVSAPIRRTFVKGVLGRPVELELVTETPASTIPYWLTSRVWTNPMLLAIGGDTEVAYVAGVGVTVGSGLVTAWADQSGNGNDLTTASGDPEASLQFGYGYHPKLTETDQFLRTANDGPLQGISGAAGVGRIWLVFRAMTGSPNNGKLLYFADPASPGATYDYIQIDGSGFIHLRDNDASEVQGAIAVADGEPHLLEVEIDLANNTITTYIDGVQDGTNAAWTADLSGVLSGTTALWLGDGTAVDTHDTAWIHFLMVDSATPSATRIANVRAAAARAYGIIGLIS